MLRSSRNDRRVGSLVASALVAAATDVLTVNLRFPSIKRSGENVCFIDPFERYEKKRKQAAFSRTVMTGKAVFSLFDTPNREFGLHLCELFSLGDAIVVGSDSGRVDAP